MDSTAVAIIDRVESSLVALASSLQVPAEHVYEVLVRQAFMEAIAGIALWGAFVILLGILCLYGLKHGTKDGFEGNVPVIISLAISSVVGIGILMSAMVTGADQLTRLLNPEYYAIQDLLKVVQ